MAIRQVPALLLINALLAIPLCTLGCSPTQLTVPIDGGQRALGCHESSGSERSGKDIPDSSPESDSPCTYCAHLFNAIKRAGAGPLLTLTVLNYYQLSPTRIALHQTPEFKQGSSLETSSPPRLTSALRI